MYFIFEKYEKVVTKSKSRKQKTKNIVIGNIHKRIKITHDNNNVSPKKERMKDVGMDSAEHELL